MNSQNLENYFIQRQVPDQTQEFLRALAPNDLEAVSSLVQNLSPSSNMLRSLIDLLGDIQHRDKLSFLEIFEQVSIGSLLASSGSSKDKQLKLKTSLLRIRYPEKYEIEDKLAGLVDSIRKNFGLRVTLPEELEGDQLQLNIQIRDTKDLSSYSEKLSNLSSSEEIQELFSILRGES